MESLISLIILFILVLIGYFFGQRAEKKHYQSIKRREKKWLRRPTHSNKKILGVNNYKVINCHLVTGNVVISVDYFKKIAAGLRNIIGGNVQSYETLVDRARREAVLRLNESCPEADQILNLRLETSSIFKGNQKQVGSVEVLAYGTAVYFEK